MADPLVVIARCLLDGQPGAREDFAEGVDVLVEDAAVGVGVYSILVSIYATIWLRARWSEPDGESADGPLPPVRDKVADHLVNLSARMATAALEHGVESSSSITLGNELESLFREMHARPDLIRSGLGVLPIGIVMSERARKIDALVEIR
jgi:hypothetical protein